MTKKNNNDYRHNQPEDYLDFIKRSKYIIKEGIFFVGDNREYELVIKDVKKVDFLEDETQKLMKIFFNDLRDKNLKQMVDDAGEFIVYILNRKILVRKSQYFQQDEKKTLKKINIKNDVKEKEEGK